MVRLATPFIRGTARLFSPVLRRVRIEGVSMIPAYGPGEYVWVRRSWRSPRVGTVVATRDPEAPNREIVKRVISVRTGFVTLEGDNREVSRDSRSFGDIAARGVKWRVIPQRRP